VQSGPLALADALATDKDALIGCWRARVQAGLEPEAAPAPEIIDSLPAFLDELIVLLKSVGGSDARWDGDKAGRIAVKHGAQRFHAGFSLGAVIREYGLLRDCMFDFIRDHGIKVELDELRPVFTAVNSAVAEAAEQFTRERDQAIERQSEQHFGFIAHELRTPLTAAMFAVHALQRRQGAERDVAVQRLDRQLSRLRQRIDNSLAHVRIREMGRRQTVDAKTMSLRALVDDAVEELASNAEEQAIAVHRDGDATAVVDPRLMHSAIANLIGNALKYTRRGGSIHIRIRGTDQLASVEVEDECGGLPDGKAEELFTPFVQRGADRSGFGLGLAIAKDAVEAHRGTVQVTNLPGKGCVFMLSVPRG
jgi:signal transduction histidine kinase